MTTALTLTACSSCGERQGRVPSWPEESGESQGDDAPETLFDPEAILSDMAAGGEDGGEPGGDTDGPGDVYAGPDGGEEDQSSMQAMAVQRDGPNDPAPTTKAAGPADLLKALAAWGPVKVALDTFKAMVDEAVANIGKGNVTPKSVSFSIAGLGVAVVAAQPIPIRPYLSVTLDPMNKKGMFTLDLGKLLKIPGFDGGGSPPTGADRSP